MDETKGTAKGRNGGGGGGMNWRWVDPQRHGNQNRLLFWINDLTTLPPVSSAHNPLRDGVCRILPGTRKQNYD